MCCSWTINAVIEYTRLLFRRPIAKLLFENKRRPCWGTTYYLTFRYSNYLLELKYSPPLSINILTGFMIIMYKVPGYGRFWL